MKQLIIEIITKSEDLPELEYKDFFHSKSLFCLCENTPRIKPLMVVCKDADGMVAAHLLAVVRIRASWFPPLFFMHARVYGEGEYETSEYSKDMLFGMMNEKLTHHLRNKVLYIEYSHISQKMFGYRQFKVSGYFPVHWMSIHNSLHSHAPKERLSLKMLKRIRHAEARGVTTNVVATPDDFRAFIKLLKRHNIMKPKRYIPDEQFFANLSQTGKGKMFVTKVHSHVIGCSAVVFSNNNAYLWYSAFRRKSFAPYHPDIMTIWGTIENAYREHYNHVFFMDVGLPFRRNLFRDFILRFGGKPVSTYRWFRVNIHWINSLLSWIYRQ